MRLLISTLGKYGHVQVLLSKMAPFFGRICPQLIHGSVELYEFTRQTAYDQRTDHANDAIYVAIVRILCYTLRCGLKCRNT